MGSVRNVEVIESGNRTVEMVEVSARQGRAATIAIGTVTTGEPGSRAEVKNSGTQGTAVFDFVIPAGESVEFRVSGGNVQWKTTNVAEWQNLVSVADIQGYSNYAVCSTPGATAAKAVSIPGFGLDTGKSVVVKFPSANTAAGATLDVSNTGARAITFQGAVVPAGWIRAGATYCFTYDGTSWNMEAGFQLAKDWAMKTDAAVDDGEYSAKKYALDAKGHKESAAGSASQASTDRSAAETAQRKAEAAGADSAVAKTAAESARATAESASSQAQSAAGTASGAAGAATQSAVAAGSAKTAAETAKAAAESAQSAAESAGSQAESARAAAVAAKGAAETAKADAVTAKTAAETAKSGAESAKAGAETAKTGAESAKDAAVTEKAAAEAAKTDAVAAKNAAVTAKTGAETAKSGADTAKSGADSAKTAALAAQTAAEAAKLAAENAKNAAQTSASGAAGSATTALNAKADAVAAKNAAVSAKTEAQSAANNAANSAQQAAEIDLGWLPQSETAIRVSTTTFSVSGDQTSKYIFGRALRISGNTVVFVLSSTAAGGTSTVTVAGKIPESITTLELGAVEQQSLPMLPNEEYAVTAWDRLGVPTALTQNGIQYTIQRDIHKQLISIDCAYYKLAAKYDQFNRFLGLVKEAI